MGRFDVTAVQAARTTDGWLGWSGPRNILLYLTGPENKAPRFWRGFFVHSSTER